MMTLDPSRVDAYLERLGTPRVTHDFEGLARLQAAHLRSVPFHNLLLLANDRRPHTLQPIEKVVEEAIAGVGGNCDRTTPPFAALLSGLGFEAHLAAATIREPGDHFSCIVQSDGDRYLCDVGNGHPYMHPWRLDGPVQEQVFQGWTFRFDPHARRGPTLTRRFEDGSERTVYTVDPTPRDYTDFSGIVHAHYTQSGFGPFLSGLRAVRILQDAVLSLRDHEYARDTPFGRTLRRVHGSAAIRDLLTDTFGLAPGLVGDALAVLARRRPDLFDEPRWFALGRGLVEDSRTAPRPQRSEVPDVLVSLATIGRNASVQTLLSSLAEEKRESGYPGRVGVIVLLNSDEKGVRHEAGAPAPDVDIHVRYVSLNEVEAALARATEAGILPNLSRARPLPIGAAREAQIAALRRHLASPHPHLPHPGEHPCIVWMLDDDMSFQQLGQDGTLRRHTNLLFRAARYWSERPAQSVIIGPCTGDPPIPGLDGLGGQLGDLAGNLERMLALGPNAAWFSDPTPPDHFDAYYDLTEATPPGRDVAWPYAPDRHEPVHDVALRLLRDLPRLLDGQQLTRRIGWSGEEIEPRPSVRRGGNALFLDFDALFRWPTPVVLGGDGVMTRRSDTLWAALASQEAPRAVMEATLPLHHERSGQGSITPAGPAPRGAAEGTAAQVRGIALSRAVAEGRDVHSELRRREQLVTAQRHELIARLRHLRSQISQLAAWRLPDIDLAARDGLGILDRLEQITASAIPPPGDPFELSTFLDGLPRAVRDWRQGWL